MLLLMLLLVPLMLLLGLLLVLPLVLLVLLRLLLLVQRGKMMSDQDEINTSAEYVDRLHANLRKEE